MPATLNKNIIQYSIDNKFGHTQKPEDTCGGFIYFFTQCRKTRDNVSFCDMYFLKTNYDLCLHTEIGS